MVRRCACSSPGRRRGVRGSLRPQAVRTAFTRPSSGRPSAGPTPRHWHRRSRREGHTASWPQARALAAHLREVAGGRAAVAAAAGRTPVAACMLPSCGVRICAYFATLAAGLAYCPIETGHPEATARTLLAAVDATVFVAAPSLASLAPEGIPTVALTWESVEGLRGGAALPPPASNAVAHVVFTSGSTGTPKGVVCAHAGSLASHAATRAAALQARRRGGELHLRHLGRRRCAAARRVGGACRRGDAAVAARFGTLHAARAATAS